MKLPKAKLPAGFRFDREEANERTEALHDTAQPSTDLETGASFAQRIHQRFKGLDNATAHR